MKILVIEDKIEKYNDIKNCISDWHIEKKLGNNLTFTHAKNMQQVYGPLHKTKFDLIIFDVFMPTSAHSEEYNCSLDIIFAVKDSCNKLTESIVLTALPSSEDRALFNDNGVTFVSVNDSNKAWQESLIDKLERIAQKISFKFLILCALSKERQAFEHTDAIIGESKNIKGLNCQEITINNVKGLCIKPSKMGLVNMAITATRAIEMFEPEFVGMSGICAGKSGSSNILDVIACTVAWDYQTGKYQNGKFIQEPYQSSQPDSEQTIIEQFLDNPDVTQYVKNGLEKYPEVNSSQLLHGAIASGSTVIADESKMEEIKGQFRKMLGLEMEIKAFYEAALQATCKPKFLAAKTVTDLGDVSKEDYFQDVGAIMSSRVIFKYIENFFKDDL